MSSSGQDKRKAVGSRFAQAKSLNSPDVMANARQAAANAANVVSDTPPAAARFAGIDDNKVGKIIKDHAPNFHRRSDYKGKRKQMSVKVTHDAWQVIKLVRDLKKGEGTAFLEQVMLDACKAELERLRAELDPAVIAQAEADIEAELK